MPTFISIRFNEIDF